MYEGQEWRKAAFYQKPDQELKFDERKEEDEVEQDPSKKEDCLRGGGWLRGDE